MYGYELFRGNRLRFNSVKGFVLVNNASADFVKLNFKLGRWELITFAVLKGGGIVLIKAEEF